MSRPDEEAPAAGPGEKRGPRVSVVVRSYNRLPALCTLLETLLLQRHDSFEVVVVEQSTRVEPEAAARLAELERDPRLRVIRREPLGGPAARNVGVAAARGAIVVLIDDDDLPVGDEWIALHEACYDDPRCLGVSGRQIVHDGEQATPLYRWLARRRCLKLSPLLRMPLTYVRHEQPVAPVDLVHGTNGSIRRSAFERFGPWDEDTRVEDEASFFMRAARLKAPDEYFKFDPRPLVRRGLDTGGGLEKRFLGAGAWFARLLHFVHHIVGRYYPARLVLLYPLYVFAAYGWTVSWVMGDSRLHRTWPAKLAASAGLLVTLPLHVGRAIFRSLNGASPAPAGSRPPSLPRPPTA